jgi:hypothetical protein
LKSGLLKMTRVVLDFARNGLHSGSGVSAFESENGCVDPEVRSGGSRRESFFGFEGFV